MTTEQPISHTRVNPRKLRLKIIRLKNKKIWVLYLHGIKPN